MPLLTDRQTVAANTSVQNSLAGKSLEFLQAPSAVEVAVVAAAVGVFYTVLIGTEVIVEDQEASSQNRFGIYPDDFTVNGGGLPGNRLVVKLRNSTGAGIVVFTSCKITPMA